MDWQTFILGVILVLVGIAVVLFGLSLIWQARATELHAEALQIITNHLAQRS